MTDDTDKLFVGTCDRIVYSCDEVMTTEEKEAKFVELVKFFAVAPDHVLILDGGQKLWVVQLPK